MIRWVGIFFGTLRSSVRTHRELALENLALRQQLAVWKAREPRPRLTEMDRIFWVLLSRLWASWRHALQVVRPETVVGWHRQGFRRYWAWKSRPRHGRPRIRTELRDLIRRMSRANPLGCTKNPRRAAEARPNGLAGDSVEVHGPASEAAVAGVANILEESRHRSARVGFLHGADGDLSSPVRARDADAQTAPARAFQCNGASDCGMDGAATARSVRAGGGAPVSDPGPRPSLWRTIFAPAKTLDIREAVIAPRSPWQNAYAERVIGSIRRECLDHVVVIGERHLREILSKYVDYYNGTRTHLSLAKDAPEPRGVQVRSEGRVVEVPRVGGLHHQYLRRAA